MHGTHCALKILGLQTLGGQLATRDPSLAHHCHLREDEVSGQKATLHVSIPRSQRSGERHPTSVRRQVVSRTGLNLFYRASRVQRQDPVAGRLGEDGSTRSQNLFGSTITHVKLSRQRLFICTFPERTSGFPTSSDMRRDGTRLTASSSPERPLAPAGGETVVILVSTE